MGMVVVSTLAAVNGAAMDIWVPVFVWTYIVYLGEELPGHMIILCLTFRGAAKLFLKMATPPYIPSGIYERALMS